MTDALTSLGELLEQARLDLGLSTRAAARLASLSDTRWRQVVRGVQVKAGQELPANPTARTVVSMATAVKVDPGQALQAAGLETAAASVQAMVDDLRVEGPPPPSEGASGLAEEIERVKSLPISPSLKLRIARSLIDLYAEQAARPEVDRQAPV